MKLQDLISTFQDNNPNTSTNTENFLQNIFFRKNEYILKKNEISDKLFFITSGIIIEYDYDNSSENSDNIYVNSLQGPNEWFFQPESFIEQKPSLYYIKALSKVEAIYITKENLKQLISQIPNIAVEIMSIYEQYLINIYRKSILLKNKKAENRLELFEKYYPKIASHVSQYIIASYLNISRSELSRIRSRRSKKQIKA